MKTVRRESQGEEMNQLLVAEGEGEGKDSGGRW